MDKLAKYDKEVSIDLNLSQLGEVFAKSGFFQNCRDANQAIVKILAGQENGFGPFTSMKDIHLIPSKGGGVQVEIGAHLHAAAVRASALYDFKVQKLTNEECALEFMGINKITGKWESLGISSFTQKDAEKAGLIRKDGAHEKFPRNMYFARAMTNGVEWYCPDVFQSRMYGPGEITGKIQEQSQEGEVVDAEYFEDAVDIEEKLEKKQTNNNHDSQEYKNLNQDCAYIIWLLKRADMADNSMKYTEQIQWYEKREYSLEKLQKALPTLTEKIESEDFRFVIPTPEEMDEWHKRMREVYNVESGFLDIWETAHQMKHWNDVCHLYFDAQWEYEHQEEQK